MAALTRLLIVGWLVGIYPSWGLGQEKDRQLAEDEQVLKSAGISTDGARLVDFFRSLVPTEKDRRHIEALVRQLGDGNFRVREKARADLISLGRPALGPLRMAEKEGDLETQRRAVTCIQVIEKRLSADVLAAAVRLIEHRKPAGAVPVLLDFVPLAPEEAISDEVLAALVTLGIPDDAARNSLEKAMDDTNVPRRAAAVRILGQHGNPADQRAVRRFADEGDPLVRLRAAQGLLAARDKSAIPVLVALLQEDIHVARRAEDSLMGVAGEQAPAVFVEEDRDTRRKCVEAWQQWWRTNEKTLDLAKVDLNRNFGVSFRAQDVSRQFLQAMFRGDLATVHKTTDVPFSISGILSLKTREEFDQLFRQALEAQKQKKKPSTFSIFKVVTADEFAKIGTEKDRELLKTLRKPEIRVVYIRGQWGTANMETAAVVVRLNSQGARVIGITECKPTDPKAGS